MGRLAATVAIIATLLGLGLLASFQSAPTKSVAVTAPPPTTAPPTNDTNPTPTTAPAATAPPNPGSTNPPAASAPTTPSTAARSNVTKTVDGAPVDNQFGTVQVRVTIRNGQITDVTALQMPYDHQRSAYISQQAEPYLRQEALQAQSAQIDLISGATYTSESYAQSLQSALDKAKA